MPSTMQSCNSCGNACYTWAYPVCLMADLALTCTDAQDCRVYETWVICIQIKSFGPQVLQHFQAALACGIVQSADSLLILGSHVRPHLQQLLNL